MATPRTSSPGCSTRPPTTPSFSRLHQDDRGPAKAPYWEGHRGILPGWVQANAAKKDMAKRIDLAKAELAKSDKDTGLRGVDRPGEGPCAQGQAGQVVAIRGDPARPNRGQDLPDASANDLFYQQQYYLRHYSPAAEHRERRPWPGPGRSGFPKSEQPAYNCIQWATDFAPVKDIP